MVVCRYFQQGNCRFGASCRNEHVYDSKYNYTNPIGGNSVLRAPSQQTVEVIRSVVNDALSAEKGAQWLLSCYAPFKKKPLFPSFKDYSFEEIRLETYQAHKQGTFDKFKQELAQLFESASRNTKALQNPNDEIIGLILKIYNTPDSESPVAITSNSTFDNANTNFNSSLFGVKPTIDTNTQPNSNSIFGQNPNIQSGGTVFGLPQQQPQQPIFGNTAKPGNIFAVANQQLSQTNLPLFAPQPEPVQPTNIFALANQQLGPASSPPPSQVDSVFPQPPPNQNLFDTQQKLQFASSPQPAPLQPPNIFGNQQNISPFNSPTNANVQPRSLFPSADPNSVFGNRTNSVFGTVPQNTGFSNVANPNSVGGFNSNSGTVFGTPVFNESTVNSPLKPADASSHSASIFGGNQANQNPVFSNQTASVQSNIDKEIFYSKLDQINEYDVEAYRDDAFVFGKIPEIPPPKELCYP